MYTNRLMPSKKCDILRLRNEGYTQQAIADLVGCHRNTVGRFLRNRSRVEARGG